MFGRKPRRGGWRSDNRNWRHDRETDQNRTGNNAGAPSRYQTKGNDRGPIDRKRFLGFRKLQELERKSPTEILFYLKYETSGFKELLYQENHFKEMKRCIWSVIGIACRSEQRENLTEFLKSINEVKQFTVTGLQHFLLEIQIGLFQQEDVHSLESVTTFLETLQLLHPDTSLSTITLVLPNLKDTVKSRVDSIGQGLLDRLQRLEDVRDKARERYTLQLKNTTELTVPEPSNCFRDISIFPDRNDITNARPFLRPNIVEGRYKDLDHYLDVQFRLLREDFVRPLREGIAAYQQKQLIGGNSRVNDIKVYHDVQVIRSMLSGDGVIHELKLPITAQLQRVQWESSKSLIFGSLLCFTTDNFVTMSFATVALRDPEKLRNGFLIVRFEEKNIFEIDKDFGKLYTMVETEAYFEAYRHVLIALQEISLQSFPLQEYIVNVEKHIKPPKYAEKIDQVYCFGPILKCNQKYKVFPKKSVEKSEDECIEELEYESEEDSPKETPRMMGRTCFCSSAELIPIHDTKKWSEKDLGLDKSQLEALKSALTQSISIIQGPPGTGKTYVGLKIVQLLLHNSQVWAPTREKTPIVVVCYTNHALDQFLEGILESTENIVRIGGRSKNKTLDQYNLKELRKRPDSSVLYDYTNRNRREIESEMSAIGARISIFEKMAKRCKEDVISEIELSVVISEPLSDSLNNQCPSYISLTENAGKLLFYWLGIDVPYYQNSAPLMLDAAEIEAKERPHVVVEEVSLHETCVENSESEDEIDINLPYDDIPNDIENRESKKVDAPKNLKSSEDDAILTELNKIKISQHKESDVPDQEIPKNVDKIDLVSSHLKEIEIAQCKESVIPEKEIHKNNAKIDSTGTDVVDCLDDSVDLDFLNGQRMVDEEYQEYRTLRRQELEERPPSENESGEWKTQGGNKLRKRNLRRNLNCNAMTEIECEALENVWSLKPQDRWRLYRAWLDKYLKQNEIYLLDCKKEYERQLVLLGEVKHERERLVISNARVVGLTTTGAAKYKHLIRGMRSKIVIVEEAAEVLEAHIVTALNQNTQHLILIGDHQQLRPNPTVYELAKKYHLEISLFERLIKNGLPYSRLNVQHRMKPCISKLLVPNIYKDLEDHHTVQDYEDIKGMEMSMYFVSHNIKEFQSNDSNSRVNTHEIDYLVELCRYLLLQGYNPSRIIILTTYLAQFFMLKKKMIDTLKEVRVSVVDNFQGEESDIILLSFVRSNDDGVIGFLKADNRICVSLSRAKQGLYCIGNFELFASQSKLWATICEELRDQNAIGDALNTKCQNHGNLVSIKTAADFFSISDGGCLEKCNFRLTCGHVCSRKCHPDDRDHKKFQCKKQCDRLICESNHRCPRVCWEVCGKCLVPVEKVIPSCQHTTKMACHIDPSEFVCQFPCTKTLLCGHLCSGFCGSSCKKCIVFVTRESPCGHEVRIYCCFSEESDKLQSACTRICERKLECGHDCTNRCDKKCTEICKVDLIAVLKCGHELKASCSKVSENEISHWEYNKERPTPGFLRRGLTVSNQEIKCQMGHFFLQRTLKNVHRDVKTIDLDVKCSIPCGQELECGHICKGTCGQCVQGRLHITCSEVCGKVLVCGHLCPYPCANSCPPCVYPCETSCVHSRCTSICGYPCAPCMEPCAWRCKYYRCTRRCSEPCDRPPCNRPCTRKLRCRHKCIGMCGEPCPTLCRNCNVDEVTSIFFGGEDHPRARFLQLQDCGHVFDVGGLTRWIEVQGKVTAEIQMPTCPLCKVPIRKNMRFNSLVNQAVVKIERIKLKIFGSANENASILNSLIRETMMSPNAIHAYATSTDPCLVYGTLRLRLRSDRECRKIDQEKLSLYQNYLKFADKNRQLVTALHSVMGDMPTNIAPFSLDEIYDFFGSTLRAISQKILDNMERGSVQLLNDISCEMHRLEIIVIFFKEFKLVLKSCGLECREIITNAVKLLLSHSPFSETEVERLSQFKKEIIKLSEGLTVLGITEAERVSIVKALGMKQGHWYTCPNGHVYCITECGGAMEESRCSECGAAIGGRSHRLRSDNRVATAMDGARHSAWSENANMDNFDLNNLH